MSAAMNLSLRTFCRIIGLAMLVIGLSMFPSLIVAVIYKETVSFLAFLRYHIVCGGLRFFSVMVWTAFYTAPESPRRISDCNGMLDCIRASGGRAFHAFRKHT